MISDWLKILLSSGYVAQGMDYNSKNRNFYKRQDRDLRMRGVKSVSAKSLIGQIKNSSRFHQYKNYLDRMNLDCIYDSECHGLNHNERVSLFTFYLADKLNLTDRELKLALYGAFYHDIGRVDDLTDDLHGERSADMLDGVVFGLNDEEMRILKTVISSHSLDDSMFNNIVKRNDVKNYVLCEKLFKILKDSDALDRVRLEKPLVVPSVLRFNESRELILASYQLYNNYEKIKENLEEKEL